MAILSPSPKLQFFDSNGNPLVGGKLYSYTAGTTSPLATYTDSTNTSANTNPIILDSRGEASVWLGSSAYKLVLYSATDILIWSVDNVTAASSDTLANLAASGGSSLIGYTQGGTGAVPTTVQTKLRESVSVFDFLSAAEKADVLAGAFLIDVSASVQRALDSAYRIYFPAGGYFCGNLQPGANRVIYGDGFNSIFKQSTSTGGRGVFFQNSGSASTQINGLVLRDIQVLGTVATDGFAQFVHAISLNGVKNVLIDNVYVTGFRGDGIYIGSGDAAGQERHNTNVIIQNCTIDGVNNDNRNGISVIDGDKITISNCNFINCTRSNMPGAIDFEPDAVAYAVIKNAKVVGNTFKNCGGNVAHIGFYLAATTYTVAPENIVIHGNQFDGGVLNLIAVLLPPAGYSTPTNLSIVGNTGDGNQGVYVAGINGGSISNNVFNLSGLNYVGFSATDVIKNFTVTGNTFRGTGATAGLVTRGVLTNVTFANNSFDNYATAGIQVGISSGNISKLAINNNTFNNISGSNLSVNFVGGTIDGTYCTYLGNTHSGTHNFPAWRNDTCGTVSNGVAASNGSWNSLTLPDAFPEGVSNAAVNGDTGVPSTTGGYQGVLTTYRMSAIANKYTYQLYFHANNGLKLGSFFVRRRDSTTNTWTAWVEQAS